MCKYGTEHLTPYNTIFSGSPSVIVTEMDLIIIRFVLWRKDFLNVFSYNGNPWTVYGPHTKDGVEVS